MKKEREERAEEFANYFAGCSDEFAVNFESQRMSPKCENGKQNQQTLVQLK